VASQGRLDVNDALWGKEMVGTIEMRLKANPLLRQFAHCSQAEDLVAPAVRQNRPVPAHEAMQPAQLANQLRARTEIEMIGITKENLATHFFQISGQHRLDRPLSPHRHKSGGLHDAMRGD